MRNMTGRKAMDELEKAASQIQGTCTYPEVGKKTGEERHEHLEKVEKVELVHAVSRRLGV